MSLQGSHRIKILSVFNRCTETTIPSENFLKIDSHIFEKHILSFYQSDEQVLNYVSDQYSEKEIACYGLNFKGVLFPVGICKLFAILLKIKPDIIHVHHSLSGLVASVIALPFRKTNIITTIHNNFKFFNRRQKIIFFLTYILSNLIVCNSNTTKRSIEKLRRSFLPRIPNEVIYNGVDIKKVEKACHRPAPANHFVVGTVGRLVPQKDYVTLIKAFADFNKKRSDSELKIIGDGPLREPLELLTEKLGIREKVEFCGCLPREKVYEKLSSFHLFIVSSKWEGFCNAAVEAMVARVPVIASKIETLLEVIGCDNGTFFEVGDSKELCEKLINCYDSYDMIKKTADRAYNFASERYSLETSTARYAHAYKTILADK